MPTIQKRRSDATGIEEGGEREWSSLIYTLPYWDIRDVGRSTPQ